MSYLFRGLAADGGIRVVAADTTDIVREAVRRQGTTATAGAAVGRAITGALLLAHVLLKAPADRVTLRLRGGGPLGAVTADAGLDGTVRGYTHHPHVDLPLRADGKLDVGGAIGRDGDIDVIRSHAPYGDPYTSSQVLTSGEVAEDIATYLAVSEQIPSAVLLGVHFDAHGEVSQSGGVILQALPGAADAALAVLEANVLAFEQLTTAMRRAPLLTLVDEELCWGLGFELLTRPPLSVSFACRCSDAKALESLAYFTKEERESMVVQDGGAEVVCHWCGERRWFDARAIGSIEGTEYRCPDCDTLWYREGQNPVLREGERCSCGRLVELPS
jgi:molecular chaperone Hsp33